MLVMMAESATSLVCLLVIRKRPCVVIWSQQLPAWRLIDNITCIFAAFVRCCVGVVHDPAQCQYMHVSILTWQLLLFRARCSR
jgi:hypothetical protein